MSSKLKLRSDYRLFTVIFLVILLTSLTLNVILFIQGRQYYLQLNETRLDPLGLRYYPSDTSQSVPTPPDKKVVVIFGDSRAASWVSPSDVTNLKFVQRGINAQTSAQTVGRFDYHVKPLQPQIIIIQVGINDLKTISLFPEQKKRIIANYQENIRQLVKRSTDIGAIVILTTIFPVGEIPVERKPFWSDEVTKAIDEVNAYIHTLERQDVIVFDTYTILVTDGVTRSEYFQDELHLNRAGYELLNRELSPILAALK